MRPGSSREAFITEQTWFDLRLTILGFTAMCRYLFSREDWVKEGGRRRFLHPRVFSQVWS